MGKTLVLAEKPSVARDLARVLGCHQKGSGCLIGTKYIVTWALGHLVTLASPEMYDKKYSAWRLEDLPMLPNKTRLVVISQTRKQFNAVSSLMSRKDVDDLIVATDAGREGELVARWIMIKAGWKKPAKRLWISSQTDKSIKGGFASLKPLSNYDNLFESAQARALADWLVGLNVTRALTCKHNAQLSAGRVQTPTLSLIVSRENEIRKFVPKNYFTVVAQFNGFKATYRDSKNISRIFDENEAEKIAESVNGKSGIVSQVKKENRFKAPPAAYDLTELQRDANKRFSYSAKQTLSIMQSLYEQKKLLTYPRTDSRYITDDIVETLPERLKSIAIGPYRESANKILRKKLQTKYIVNNSKVSDHHAIIPTEQYVDLLKLTNEERNIYDLVVRRFLAVLSEPFEYEEVKVKIDIDNHSFYAKGKTVKSMGWKAFYSFSNDEDDDNDSHSGSQQLPVLNQGEKMAVRNCKTVLGRTKPPERYTEATLLSAMENPSSLISDNKLRNVIENTSGLGTPATRADIIEKLFDSFYVERHGKAIHPTSKGEQLIGIVPNDLKSAELTAKWEQQLQLISKGKIKRNDFVAEMKSYASSLVKSVVADSRVYTHDNMTREKCPECGKYLLDVNGKKGRMLVCPDRECGYRKRLSVITNARCPNCHKKLEMRGEGDKKTFFCSCGYREKLSDFEKRKSDSGANKHDVQKYMQKQRKEEKAGNSDLAEQLAKWMEESK